MAIEEQKLLRYFMEQTEKRFDKSDAQMVMLHSKIDGLNEFKIRMLVSSRWISAIISTGFGIITMAVTVGTSIYMSRLERQALLEAARIEKPAIHAKKDAT